MRETRFPSSVFRHGDVPFLRALIAHFTFRILYSIYIYTSHILHIFFETENFTYRVFYNNIEIHGHFSNSARSNRDSKLIEEARA